MYHHLGFLGQTQAMDPNAAPVPGQQYTLNFSVAGTSYFPSSDASEIQSVLAGYTLFSNGALTLIGVSLSGTTLSVTVQANAAAASVTLGGIEAAMASWFNAQGVYGEGPSGFTLTPANAPGLGTTTFTAQLQQTPTPGILQTIQALVSPPAAPAPAAPAPSGVPTWAWWAGGGVLALALVYAIS